MMAVKKAVLRAEAIFSPEKGKELAGGFLVDFPVRDRGSNMKQSDI
jgi:hypothetical protein